MTTTQTVKVHHKRILYIDILKLFTIFLVLWGHSIMHFQPDYENSIIFQTIYAFHMPLFMMLSGYFATSSMTLGAWKFFAKKARQLLLPCLSWGLVCWFVITSGLLDGKFHLDFKSLFTGWLGLIDNFWFLKSCFICYALTWLCWRFGRYKLLAIGLIWILCTMQGRFNLGMMFPSFVTGLYLRKSANIDRWLLKHSYLPLGIFTVMLLVKVSTQYATPYPFKLVLGLTGAIGCFELFKLAFEKLSPTPRLQMLAKIGENTLGIYVLQAILLEYVMPHYASLEAYPMPSIILLMPVLSLLVLGICLLIIKPIEHFPRLSFIMFGRTSG